MNNQSYVYEEEQGEEGLTFKKVGHFFRKGWLRMLVYAVVCALLVTAIALPIKVYYKSEPVAQTSIEYIYDGVEIGLAPDGSVLNTDNVISTTVLYQAVKAANLEKKITDISKLRERMRVEGVLTDEYVKLAEAAANGDNAAKEKLRNYNMFSTRFDIIISDPDELDLYDDQAKLLLNKIVVSYFADFQKRFSLDRMFASDAYGLSDNDLMEFADIYDIYTQSLESVKTFLQGMVEENSSFVSTENSTTFTQLLSELNLLRNNYSLFNAYILSNNVWRNKASARNALVSTRTEILNKLEPLNGENGYISSLKSQIATIQPTTTSTDAGGVHTDKTEYPPIYATLHAKLDEANRLVADYNVQLNNIEARLEKLQDETETGEELIQNATTNLKALEAQTGEFIQKVNSTISDYYDTTFIASSVRQVQPPVVTRRSSDFNLLLVYGIAVIVGLLAAGIVTIVKISRANAAAKSEQNATLNDGEKTE